MSILQSKQIIFKFQIKYFDSLHFSCFIEFFIKMLLDDYYWHYDYARLAWDTGFCFEKYKYPNLDKNKICLIDIDRIIKERDVASVERNIPIVVQYVLESDQAIVLDSNFVKLFRLSQLSVEYLLFCKKYLDKTVVLLKKDVSKLKQELKELKHYIEELESHISSSRNLTARYSCETCSKMFSSEDYLNAHVKRRHTSPENKNSVSHVQTEAEKLHSEIKELKERLNSTEKFIQEKPSPREVENFKEVSTETEGKTAKLVCEIQESFEKFRNQVEDKMNNLQTEKNFFTDKYDKLFDVVLHYKNKEKEEGDQDSKCVEKPVMEVPRIEDSSTQTEHAKTEKILKIQTFQHDNTYNVAETVVPDKAVEDIDQKLEKKLTNFEESIESKISTGLGNIENQIQAFWQKLSEVDLPNQQVPDVSKIVDKHIQQVSNDSSTQEEVKPVVKPRTKFTITEDKQIQEASAKKQIQETVTKKHIQDDVDREVRPKSSLQPKSKADLQPAVIIKPAAVLYESSSELSGSEEVSLDEELIEAKEHRVDDKYASTEAKPKPFLSKMDHKLTPVKPQIISSKDLPHKKQKDDALEEIRGKLISTIDCSLQEMGISPRWNGIPQKTFERALEIVQHQAAVSKKSLPQYDSLRKSIEKMLKNNKELKEAAKKVKTIRKEDSPHKSKSKPKTIKIQIKKNELPISKPSPVVTIKNPALYDTESETDMKPYLPKSFNQEKNDPDRKSLQEKAHSAVIEELQSKFSLKLAETDSDLNSIDDKDVQKETKSAMKSFSSEGSLVKKKVFFDVENLDREDEVKAKTESELKAEKKNEDSISDFEIT
ncbi:uncharacterized protein DZIP1 [Diabrotica undecimpunctata]|uniref:uncharacterized protein DZIP1 n=1 Tax=Diabrotica undecimpunctata TaxID=50387 RepID=UPI003B63A8BC